jgi:hypothetical protein
MKTLTLLLFFLSAPVFAQVTYTYTGQTLINGTWGPTIDGGTPPTVTATLSGTVTLSTALNPNQANQVVSPASWSFGGITSDFLSPGLLAIQTNPALNASFVFSTVNGQITAWAISISWNYGTNGPVTGSGTITSTSQGGLGSDSWVGSPESGVSHCGFVYACDTYSAYVMQPGTWNGVDPPPPADPDASEVASLQAQVASLQSQLATSQIDAASYARGYLAANALVTELNAAIMVCRTHQGHC